MWLCALGSILYSLTMGAVLLRGGTRGAATGVGATVFAAASCWPWTWAALVGVIGGAIHAQVPGAAGTGTAVLRAVFGIGLFAWPLCAIGLPLVALLGYRVRPAGWWGWWLLVHAAGMTAAWLALLVVMGDSPH